MSVPAGKAEALLARLHESGITDAAIIGEVTDRFPGRIKVEPA